MKTEKITLRISEEEKKKATILAQKKDISVSQLLREALRDYILKQD